MALCEKCEREICFKIDDWDEIDDWYELPEDNPEDYPDWDGDESIMYLIDNYYDDVEENEEESEDREYNDYCECECECENCGSLI